MNEYFLRNLSELAEKKAILTRQEAQLWDVLSRDLKREAQRKEDRLQPRKREVLLSASIAPGSDTKDERKIFVRIKEACSLLGMSKSSLYKEMSEGRLKVRKSGRTTLIPMTEIQAWIDQLGGRG